MGRLPRPPAVFVGRQDLLAEFARAVAQAPLVVVVGASGVGKTALVRHHFNLTAERSHIACVACQPDGTLDALARQLASHLADASAEVTTWQSVFELVDAKALTVVIDNAEHLQPKELARLFRDTAGYAEGSRWIVTSRVAPTQSELAEHVVVVRALSDEESHELAGCLVDDDSTALKGLVADSGGNPLRIRELVLKHKTTHQPPTPPKPVAHELIDRARAALRPASADGQSVVASRRLFDELSASDDGTLTELRIEIAVASGDERALVWANQQPAPSTREGVRAWLRSMLLLGRITLADSHAQAVIDNADSQAGARFEARLVRSRCAALAANGEVAEAFARAAEPADETDAVSRDAAIARALFLQSRFEAARHLAQDVGERLEKLPDEPSSRADLEVGMTALQLGLPPTKALPTQSFEGALLIAVGLLIQGGLRAAADMVRDVEPPTLSSNWKLGAIRWAIAGFRGDWAEAERRCDELDRVAVDTGNPEALRWSRVIARVMAHVVGDTTPWPDTDTASWPQDVRAVDEVLERCRLLRLGHDVESPPTEVAPQAKDVLFGVDECLLRGRPEQGVTLAERGIEMLSKARWYGFEAEVSMRLVWARLASGDFGAALQAIERAGRFISMLPDTTFRSRLMFYHSLLHDQPPIDMLRVVADDPARPEARLVARYLLGRDRRPDRLAMAIGGPARQRWHEWEIGEALGHELSDGWCIVLGDEPMAIIDGAQYTLRSGSLAVRLLQALVEGGGTRSANDLALAAWDIADYHPLRDRTRLHVAMKRLRDALGPMGRKLIRTVEGGYALARPVAWCAPAIDAVSAAHALARDTLWEN